VGKLNNKEAPRVPNEDIENFSHPNRVRHTPHAGPTRHLFLKVDMVEGL
jgi:hypothetical protein